MRTLLLSTKGLVKLTWGNVSAITKDGCFMVIKLEVLLMRVGKKGYVDSWAKKNKVVSTNQLNSSTDAPTHLLLYQTFPSLQGITHTHSTFATSWGASLSRHPLSCLALFKLTQLVLPLYRPMTINKTKSDYELNTGRVIIETLAQRGLGGVEEMPGILVSEHGVFTWSTTSAQHSVEVAVALEEIAKMALFTRLIAPSKNSISPPLKTKHFQRKHGKQAYYWQKKPSSF